MKKLLTSITFLVSLFFSYKVYANWTYVAKTQDNEYFIDINTKKIKGTYTYIWSLINNKTVSSNDFNSYTRFMEIDCDLKSYRNLQIIGYDKLNGKGNSDRFPDSVLLKEPTFAPPETALEAVLDKACEK